MRAAFAAGTRDFTMTASHFHSMVSAVNEQAPIVLSNAVPGNGVHARRSDDLITELKNAGTLRPEPLGNATARGRGGEYPSAGE